MFCLITGASRGLGATLAEYFWNSGFDLVLIARTEAALLAANAQLPVREGQQIINLACDLADPSAVATLIARVKQRVDKLDVLLNNAAIQGPIGPAWDCDSQLWRNTLQVDLFAPVELCRNVVPWMTATGGGSIINLSGGGAAGSRVNFSAYATAKTGLVRFSEILAEETRQLNIRVNCVAPGALNTEMLAEVVAKGADAAGSREYEIAQKVLREGGASMERVAELCLFLASARAEKISGKLISAVWDDWENLPAHVNDLTGTDIYTLRRIAPRDRGMSWGDVP